MTATDQPTPRVGDTIDSVPGLDMLPAGSIVRDRDGDTLRREDWGDWTDAHGSTASAEYLLRESGPVTLVSRPDAPHPAPADGDAVEQVARVIWTWFVGSSTAGFDKQAYAYDREKCMDSARAALAAARAGEVEHACADERLTDSGSICRQCGEAVDREALADRATREAARLLAQASPLQTAPWVARLVRDVVDSTLSLAARGDAAPSVNDREELDACHAADEAHGLNAGAAEAWRHTYLAALGIEVRP